MKDARNQNNQQSKQGHVNTPRPDIRDDMDSRKNKEEGYVSEDNVPVTPKKKNEKDDKGADE